MARSGTPAGGWWPCPASSPGSTPDLRLRPLELQRAGVDAVPEARGGRAILEHVAQVTPAPLAGDLGSDHPPAAVGVQLHVLSVHGLGEAGPPRARIELGVRTEQLRPAAGAP